MCSKASVVQKKWRPMLGDWFAKKDREYNDDDFIYIYQAKDKEIVFYKGVVNSIWIWLPRQDQLQEMIYQTMSRRIDSFHLFYYPYRDSGVMPHNRQIEEWDRSEIYVRKFSSMEQLWLAFVMKEKHCKKWDGKEWKEEK